MMAIPKLWLGGGIILGFFLTYLWSFLYVVVFNFFPSYISFMILIPGAVWTGNNIYRLQKNQSKLNIGINLIKSLIPKEPTKPSFEFSKDRKTVSLNYFHGTKQHKIILPHQTRLRIKMSKHYVYLIHVDGNETNITQQPGIPYLATAKDLGGIGYKIIDNATLEIVEELDDISIPFN